MSLEIQNDLHKLKRIHEMFNAMYKTKFETEQGSDFIETLKSSIKEVILPKMVDVKEILTIRNKI